VAVVIALMLLIILPLGGASLGLYRSHTAQARATAATESWLKGSGYRLVSANAEEDQINLVVSGSGKLPSESALKAMLVGDLFGMRVSLLAMPSQRVEFDTK
jgi:hypothetical protein